MSGFTLAIGEKVTSLASIRGCAGLASDQLLLYGTAGVAWAHADFNATNTTLAAGFQAVNASR